MWKKEAKNRPPSPFPTPTLDLLITKTLTLLFLISFLRLTSSGIIIIARTQGIFLISSGIAEVSARFTGESTVIASSLNSRFLCSSIADS